MSEEEVFVPFDDEDFDPGYDADEDVEVEEAHAKEVKE